VSGQQRDIPVDVANQAKLQQLPTID